MKKGRITKLIGGLYTVLDEQNISHVLKARGKFRHKDESPKVGDMVTFNDDFIMTLFPRKNNLTRPPICNIDQAILIHSAKQPDFSFNLLDRFLLLIEHESIKPVIVITKIDLLTDEELRKLQEQMTYYEQYYDVYYLSNKSQIGVRDIKDMFNEKVSVFAGQTGAGKSSLLNSLNPEFKLETNEISKALGRGKHTTRHSELHPLFGGLVADTPGFSKLEFYDILEEEIKDCFVDFFTISSQCKFRGCTHINEPKCAVKAELEKGTILPSRYQNYVSITEEIKSQKPKY